MAGAMAMEIEAEKAAALRMVRDALLGELAVLDQLGEHKAAFALNAAIEMLNGRLSEPTSDEELRKLRARYFSN